MGEVYRARDARLGRDVALKVLPEAFSRDGERMARFEREAQVLASLNHPNIAQLYGLEELDGLRALVMEYVPGETLPCPVPIDEILPLLRQLIDALEEAHERGIVHRDLKPANIKVTPDGKVKVLDFGLAKALSADPSGSDAANSPTLATELTRGPVLLGTAAYMSPEQARGRTVDKRSDIFSCGVVLYEMLTGEQAFGGETISDSLAGILKNDPDLTRLPEGTPANLRWLLGRCLEKDPKKRLRDIGDARDMLEAEAASAAAAPVAAPARRPVVWMAATVLLAAALATLAVRHFRETPPQQQVLRYQIPAPEKQAVLNAALSPDGRRLALTTGIGNQVGTLRLWVRPLDSLTAQPLPGTEGAINPFWSADGRAIAFYAGGKLKKVDLLGSPPQILCDTPRGYPGSWNGTGVILFGRGPIFQVSAAGGEPRAVTTLDASRQENRHLGADFLPDGRHFLYTALSAVPENHALYVGSLDSKETKRLLSASGNASYTQDATGQGYILFVRARTLLAQRFNAAQLELQGEAFPVAENVAIEMTAEAAQVHALFSVSATGILSYQTGGNIDRRELVWFDRSGRVLGKVGEPGAYSNPALSPDDKQLAISRADPQTNLRDIWVFDLDRGSSSRLTVDRGDESNPVWSPDGKRIAYFSTRKGLRDIYVKDFSGAGEEQVLFESNASKQPIDWSPDGRYLIASDLGALPLGSDRKPIPLRAPAGNAHVSPDGRWMAYQSGESSRPEIYVQSFPGLLAGSSAGRWQVSTAGGSSPAWRRDGQELFYLDLNNRLTAVSVKTNGTVFEASLPKTLFPARVGGGRRNDYVVAANGQRFLVVQLPEQQSYSTPIEVVVNWPAAVQR
jgi:Tol biopolymer transport system component